MKRTIKRLRIGSTCFKVCIDRIEHFKVTNLERINKSQTKVTIKTKLTSNTIICDRNSTKVNNTFFLNVTDAKNKQFEKRCERHKELMIESLELYRAYQAKEVEVSEFRKNYL